MAKKITIKDLKDKISTREWVRIYINYFYNDNDFLFSGEFSDFLSEYPESLKWVVFQFMCDDGKLILIMEEVMLDGKGVK